jgi:glycosyltransferase involved in cell wall biosynthesis
MPEPLPSLRIAAHNGASEWGGAEIAVCRLLHDLQAREHTVRLWYAKTLVARQAAPYGVETRYLHVGGDVAIHHALRVASALRVWRPDVLIAGTFRKLLHLSLGARLTGVPLVARIGLSSDLPRNDKYRRLFRHLVAHTVVNSESLREAWLTAMPELDPARISVIYKGVAVPSDLPSRSQARAALGLEPDEFVIGGVGRLVEQKRFDRWLHVLAELPGHVKGVLVGDGPLRPSLHQRAADLGVADRVRFTGHLSSAWRALPAFDALLITSDRESMANVMLEAMAVGVPTITTPVDGAREALLAGPPHSPPAGRVADAFSAEALRALAEPLTSDMRTLQQMAQSAEARARDAFAPEASAMAWEATLQHIVQDRRSSRS